MSGFVVAAEATGTSASATTTIAASLSSRNDHNLFPRKLSGITRMIAIACDTILPSPSASRKTNSHSWLTIQPITATTKNRIP